MDFRLTSVSAFDNPFPIDCVSNAGVVLLSRRAVKKKSSEGLSDNFPFDLGFPQKRYFVRFMKTPLADLVNRIGARWIVQSPCNRSFKALTRFSAFLRSLPNALAALASPKNPGFGICDGGFRAVYESVMIRCLLPLNSIST